MQIGSATFMWRFKYCEFQTKFEIVEHEFFFVSQLLSWKIERRYTKQSLMYRHVSNIIF